MNPCLITYHLVSFVVSTLKEQLEDMRKISQNSQASNDKIIQLQNQVYRPDTHTHGLNEEEDNTLNPASHTDLPIRLTAGRGQRPPARRVGHSSETAEEPH